MLVPSNTTPAGSLPTGMGEPTIVRVVASITMTLSDVVVIDATTRTIVGSPIPVGNDPAGVVFDGTNIYVSNFSSGTLTVIDPTTETSTGGIVLPGSPRPWGMVFDGRYLYVADDANDRVSVVDPVAGSELTTITVGTNPLDVTYDGTFVYATNSVDDSVSVIDPSTRSVVGTVDLPTATGGVTDGPEGILFDGTNIWVAGVDDTVTKLLPR